MYAVVIAAVIIAVPVALCIGGISGLFASEGESGDSSGYEYTNKTEIDRLTSDDGIGFVLLDDDTARIESFPVGWNDMDQDSTEWIVPGELKVASASYQVSEIESDAVPRYLSTGSGNDVAERITSITKVTLPSSLIRICDAMNASVNNFSLSPTGGTFSYALIELVIPSDSKLEYIGAGAFYGVGSGDSDIQSVALPASVKYVGDAAFANIKSISIGDSSELEYVGDGAFSSLTSECTLTLPDTLYHIGTSKPFGNAAVTLPASFYVDNGVVYSDSTKTVVSTFIGNSTEVIISDGVEKIGDEAFFGTDITKITLPSSLKSIGKYAFANCMDLLQVSYNPSDSSLVDIGDYAFAIERSGSNLDTFGMEQGGMVFPDSLVSIGDGCFAYVTNTFETTNPNKVNSGRDGQNNEITSISFGSNISSIGYCAFENCLSLKQINFADTASGSQGTAISDYAFAVRTDSSLDRSLSVVFDPDKFKLISIGDCSLSVIYTHSTDIDTSKGLMQFGSQSGGISIPSSLGTIGMWPFSNQVFGGNPAASSLISSLVFEQNNVLSGIPDYTFYGFDLVVSLDLSPLKSLTLIGQQAFGASGTTTMTTLVLGDSIKEVGGYAFNNRAYNGEAKITFPQSLSTLGTSAFSGISFEDFEFPNAFMFGINKSRFLTPTDYDASLSPVAIPVTKNKVATLTITSNTKTVFSGEAVDHIVLADGAVNDRFRLCNLEAGKDSDEKGLCVVDGDSLRLILVPNIVGVVTVPSEVTEIQSGTTFNSSKNTKITSIIITGSDTSWDLGQSTLRSNIRTIVSSSDKLTGTFAGTGSSGGKAILYTSEELYKSSSTVSRVSGWIVGDIPTSVYIDFQKQTDDVVIQAKMSGNDTDGYQMDFVAFESGGYTSYDLTLKTGAKASAINTSVVLNDGRFTVDLSPQVYMKIDRADRTSSDTSTVTLHADGGMFSDGSSMTQISIPKGMTILDEEMKVPVKDASEVENWYSDPGLTTIYDMDSVVDADLDLYSGWKNVGAKLTFSGAIRVVDSQGNAVVTGQRVSGAVTASFIASSGMDFGSWNLKVFDGTETTSYDETLTWSPVSDTVLSVKSVQYSGADLESVIFTDTPVKDIVRAWSFGGYVDTTMGVWKGMPSTPISFDDRIYVRIASSLYMLESDTGYVLKAVESKETSDFYHYIGYGNYQILDFLSGKVYDTDLNYLYTMPVNMTSAVYNDGYFYGPGSDGAVYRFSADVPDTPGTKVVDSSWKSPYSWFGQYGQCSTPVFVDGYVYYICADGNSRYIVSVSCSDSTVGRIELNGIRGHMLDDGWLTYYDGRLYLTSYTVGLFGTQSVNDWAKITSVSIDKGTFSDVVYTDVGYGNDHTRMSSMLSKFVIIDGIGFVNASGVTGSESYLIAYDVSTMTEKCSISKSGSVSYSGHVLSASSHGSIVVTEKDGTYYIYLLPYNSGSELMVFAYNESIDDKGATTVTFTEMNGVYANKDWDDTYNSQAVRSDADGRLYWYNDGGQVSTYTVAEKNPFYFFLENGDDARWIVSYGSDPQSALGASGYATIADDGALIGASTDTSQNKTRGWNVYALQTSGSISVDKSDFKPDDYEWKMIEGGYLNGDSTAGIHYWIITTSDSIDASEKEWRLSDGTAYAFSNNIGDRSVLGESLSVVYPVSIATDIQNGKVTAVLETAAAGSLVVLKVEPAVGYGLDTIIVAGVDGTVITVTNETFTMPAQGVTVTATFKAIEYNVTIADGIQNGTVTASSQKATYGKTIVLTVEPTNGFGLKTLKVTGEDGSEVSVTENRTFTMPAQNVTVDAEFVLSSATGDLKYTVSGETTASDGRLTMTIDISRSSGTSDVEDARLVVVATYESGISVTMFPALVLNGSGAGQETVAFSSANLVSVVVDVVSGLPAGSFDSYGNYVYTAS